MINIPFNKPHLTGKELAYIEKAVRLGHISGDGAFTEKCQRYFERSFGFTKALMTTSCTDALEMSSLLMEIKPADEVIVPSYTFVSTANAFVLRGAKIVFADSGPNTPHIDPATIASLITRRTKAIVPVHYAGVACDMDPIMAIARKHGIFVVEDAAQSIASSYRGRPLGSIGHFAALSFHETKNVISGEGGLFVTNIKRYIRRAEIIREKGTNRSAFFRGQVDKYRWVDVGSSFLPSDMISAFLWAQLENIAEIQRKRRHIWELYLGSLMSLAGDGSIRLPVIPEYMTTYNYHMFYILCSNKKERDSLIAALRRRGIMAIFHYLPLHRSPFYAGRHDGRKLRQCDLYSDRLLRLPFYYDLREKDVERISDIIRRYYKN